MARTFFFATCKAQSSFSGPSGNFPITIGRSVSSYVPVTFDNLISKVAFSEPFFEPSLGQTQQVTAYFAVNVDWTLEIVNDESNVVRTVTGSGASLKFAWDGTGDGGTNIPDGVYYFHIAARTNGMSSPLTGPSNDDSLFENMMMTEEGDLAPVSEEQAIALGMDHYYVPPAPYPPVEINGEWFNWEEVYGTPPWIEVQIPTNEFATASLTELNSDETETHSSSSASSQSTTAPTRPPTAPVKNQANNYAIGFYDFQTPITRNNPKNGLPFPTTQTVRLDGCSSCNQSESDPIPEANMNSVNMIREMKKLGWKLEFQKFNDLLPINSVRRSDQGYNGDEIFTRATVGLFMDHGSYGTTLDYNPGASGSFQTYFPSGNPNDGTGESSWLRLCQFGFGGNLKWMAILACNSICDPNWNSMVSHGAIPLKETHLLLGTAAIAWMGEDIAAYWGENMAKKKQKIRDAWFNAASKQYHEVAPGVITNTVIFRVTGYPECMDDTVANNTAPSNPSSAPGNLTKQDQQVYP
ncbi:MAG TPA: FlgD immunoglobulin-like domain containing protein [Verrucomicrobiae bacterium]|nr:FlgD immunoglobulin-like domain containing protein [Verrucomicrobiae bacterium]